jgi:hypothetical protein
MMADDSNQNAASSSTLNDGGGSTSRSAPSNPMLCERLTDGTRCGSPSSFVYKAASGPAQLLCDRCASEARASGRGMRKVPLMEFSLLELLPARQTLLEEKGKLSERLTNALRDTVRAEERLVAAEERFKRETLAFATLEDDLQHVVVAEGQAFIRMRTACRWFAVAAAVMSVLAAWGWLR